MNHLETKQKQVIQIQLLLKLNAGAVILKSFNLDSNTTLVKVKLRRIIWEIKAELIQIQLLLKLNKGLALLVVIK
mgnify:FL=1